MIEPFLIKNGIQFRIVLLKVGEVQLEASVTYWSETMWLPPLHAESAHSVAQVFRNVHVHVQPEEHPAHRDEQPVAFQRQDAPKVRSKGLHLQTKG